MFPAKEMLWHMERVILHIDANSFYASVECLYRPQQRECPLSVCGDPEQRHGIVLASNTLEKQRGVKTGMAVWQAKQTCPGLVIVPPDYQLYLHFSKKLRAIYEQYSDRVESFGLDECWVDVSNSGFGIEDGLHCANEIRNRVKMELGITVSIGVSNNKIFSKLGSDYKKPDAVTVIPPVHFQEMIWKLPASDLLYVGPKTTKKLRECNIMTIGDLAQAYTPMLEHKLGKNGLMLQAFANGLDRAPVMPTTTEVAIKSVGNSTTTPFDIKTLDEARCVYYMLAESVGARMRENGFRGRCISISIRTADLYTYSCQKTIDVPTNITSEIAEVACRLFADRYQRYFPLRSVGLSCTSLSLTKAPMQLDMFDNHAKREKLEAVGSAIDGIRKRFGNQVIQRGIVLAEPAIARINPKDEHTIHLVAYFAG